MQGFIGRPLLLENPATYVEFEQSGYSETDFIGEVMQRGGCGLLLDDCWDNACAESFFHSLKIELIHGEPLQNGKQTRE